MPVKCGRRWHSPVGRGRVDGDSILGAARGSKRWLMALEEDARAHVRAGQRDARSLVRYQSLIADSARWEGFALREGDIIISTPPKCGTTWVQMICALLIFQTPDLPKPIDQISPWL